MYPNKYEIDAKRYELMRRGAQEQLASQVQSERYVSFRRAVELLVGAISALDDAPAQPAARETVVRPSKLATDSGIHQIR